MYKKYKMKEDKILDLKGRLGERYKVISSEQNKIINVNVFSIVNEMVDQETGVELVCNENQCELFEIQRGTKHRIGIFENRNIGDIALYFAVIAILGPEIASNDVRETLRKLKCDDVESAKKVLDQYIGGQYYSILDRVKGAVNLEGSENKDYLVYYLTRFGCRVPIVKNVNMQTGLVIIYNYGIKLKYFNYLKEELAQNQVFLNADEEEKIKLIFLRK